MGKLLQATEVRFRDQGQLRLLDLLRDSVLTVKGDYRRWLFYEIEGRIAYVVKNASLEEALTEWQKLEPNERFIYLLDENEDDNLQEYIARSNSVPLQQEIEHRLVGTHVGNQTSWGNILRKSRDLFDRIFN